DMDGGITIHSLAAEIGQGSDTKLAQCVAEPLGVSLDRVHVYARNTDTAPFDLGSYSSRVTFMAGNAARKAGEAIAAKLAKAAHRITGVPVEGFVLQDEKVLFAPDPSVSVTFQEALHEAMAENGALVAKGIYQEPPPMGGNFKGAAAGLAPSYSFQAYVARVTVDPETGFIRVVKVWAAHDCGKALNPMIVEGQVEGSIHMGLGQALLEEFPYVRGNILNPNLLDYRTLSPQQMPEVEVILVESEDPEGPYGAKECGEGPLLPILPAVANAVHDAVGIRLTSLPMTPDKVLGALERKAAGKTPALAGA
ncbi:MAG: molybdopterin cofactor-binding domain-containing protein, partial [Dehalococcoidia bacterium]